MSSPAKAGDPVIGKLEIRAAPVLLTGCPAFAGHDKSGMLSSLPSSKDRAASAPLQGLRQHPAVAVFGVVQVALAHDREHALQERDSGALLDGEALDLAIAGDPRIVVGDVEQLEHLAADRLVLPGRERQFRIEQIAAEDFR